MKAKAIFKTRDEIGGFASTPENRYVSLDFNHSGLDPDKDNWRLVRGIEIVVPDDYLPEEMAAAKEWARLTQAFYAWHGVDVPLRGNDGVHLTSEYGRGKRGVFHTEPFFANDAECKQIMLEHSAQYAFILAATLGRLANITFIMPHLQKSAGAYTPEGLNERELAEYLLIPALARRSENAQVMFA